MSYNRFDDGVNPETAKKAKEAGASILIVGNYIFGSEDIKQAIETLQVIYEVEPCK